MDKAHGWDQLSIRMIKICGDAIIFPLKLIFKSMINEGIFADDWKKSNVVPIHKKELKNLIKNYWPISLLPIFSKVFERWPLTRCLTPFCKINYPHLASLALYQVIPVLHNYYHLHMKCIKVLIATHPPIGWVLSLISLKHLIKFGMKAWFLS